MEQLAKTNNLPLKKTPPRIPRKGWRLRQEFSLVPQQKNRHEKETEEKLSKKQKWKSQFKIA